MHKQGEEAAVSAELWCSMVSVLLKPCGGLIHRGRAQLFAQLTYPALFVQGGVLGWGWQQSDYIQSPPPTLPPRDFTKIPDTKGFIESGSLKLCPFKGLRVSCGILLWYWTFCHIIG